MLWSLGLVVLCIDIWTRMKSGNGTDSGGGGDGGGGDGGTSSIGNSSGHSGNGSVRIITITNHTVDERVVLNGVARLVNDGGSFRVVSGDASNPNGQPIPTFKLMLPMGEFSKLFKQIRAPAPAPTPTPTPTPQARPRKRKQHKHHRNHHKKHRDNFSSSTVAYYEEEIEDDPNDFAAHPEYDNDEEVDKTLHHKVTEKALFPVDYL